MKWCESCSDHQYTVHVSGCTQAVYKPSRSTLISRLRIWPLAWAILWHTNIKPKYTSFFQSTTSTFSSAVYTVSTHKSHSAVSTHALKTLYLSFPSQQPFAHEMFKAIIRVFTTQTHLGDVHKPFKNFIAHFKNIPKIMNIPAWLKKVFLPLRKKNEPTFGRIVYNIDLLIDLSTHNFFGLLSYLWFQTTRSQL